MTSEYVFLIFLCRKKENRLKAIQEQILSKLDLQTVPEGRNLVQLDEDARTRIQALYQPLADEVGEERSIYNEEPGATTVHVLNLSGAVYRLEFELCEWHFA